jgi:ABC-2 type transport system ATP-binding protein
MSKPIISVRNLRKVFGKTVAVDRVSFDVKKGEILGLLGPNGAGKTTTLAMLLGLVTPTSGSIKILGKKMPEDREFILSRANFSSPYVQLPYGLSVLANLKVHARLYNVPNGDKKIMDLAKVFGIEHLIKRRVMTLSSGESARVNLTKAFLNDPEVLFLDEPTASLDPEAADTVRSLVAKLQKERGITIIYTSHNMQEVERLSHRIIFLHRGKILADGPTDRVLRRFNKKNLEDFFIELARSKRVPEGVAP